jgi:hypothetical protein
MIALKVISVVLINFALKLKIWFNHLSNRTTEALLEKLLLAGLFISETLLKKPDLFTDYIAISPSLWYDDRHLTKQAPELLSKHNDKVRNLYLTMANEGGTMQKGLDELLEAIRDSGLENLKTNYVDRRDNEFHWTIYHEAVLDALRWIIPTASPDYADDEGPWYLIEGANPEGWTDN